MNLTDYAVRVDRVPLGTRVGYRRQVWLTTETLKAGQGRLRGVLGFGIRYVPSSACVVPLTDVPANEAGPNDVCWAGVDGKSWKIDTDLVDRICEEEEDAEDQAKRISRWTVCHPVLDAVAVIHDTNVAVECDRADVAEALADHLNATDWEPPEPRRTIEPLVREWVEGSRGRSLKNYIAEHGYEIVDTRER